MKFAKTLLLVCLIASCSIKWHKSEGQLHYLTLEHNMEYADEKKQTLDKLETSTDTFAYFYSYRLNSESYPDYFIDDNFAWIKSNKQFKKTLKKETNDNFYISRTYTVNCKDLFNFFVSKRIDTIQTLPRIQNTQNFIQGYTDCYYPPQCILKVKCGNYSYTKSFDPLTIIGTNDTLHPVYLFVKRLKSL